MDLVGQGEYDKHSVGGRLWWLRHLAQPRTGGTKRDKPLHNAVVRFGFEAFLALMVGNSECKLLAFEVSAYDFHLFIWRVLVTEAPNRFVVVGKTLPYVEADAQTKVEKEKAVGRRKESWE